MRPYLNLFGTEAQHRFAVVSSPRTGSNFLIGGLKHLRTVKVYHEIFADHNRTVGTDFDRVFSTLFRKESADVETVGFKVFYHHLTAAEWDRFSAHEEFKIIHLVRRNRLRTLVSLDIAFKTGQWTRSARKRSVKLSDRRISLDPTTLIQRLESITTGEALTRERFRDRPMLEVVYESMVAHPEETFESIGRFLGVSDIDVTRIGLRKQNPEKLEQLILNYDDVCTLLEGTPYADCLDD